MIEFTINVIRLECISLKNADFSRSYNFNKKNNHLDVKAHKPRYWSIMDTLKSELLEDEQSLIDGLK